MRKILVGKDVFEDDQSAQKVRNTWLVRQPDGLRITIGSGAVLTALRVVYQTYNNGFRRQWLLDVMVSKERAHILVGGLVRGVYMNVATRLCCGQRY